MTDREKLIELCKTACSPDNCEKHGKKTCFECVAEYLLANGVTFQKWIPVTERLPVDWCPVLVMVRDVEKPLLGSYRENVWFHEMWNTTFVNGAVTHWMLLPEPPKGE